MIYILEFVILVTKRIIQNIGLKQFSIIIIGFFTEWKVLILLISFFFLRGKWVVLKQQIFPEIGNVFSYIMSWMWFFYSVKRIHTSIGKVIFTLRNHSFFRVDHRIGFLFIWYRRIRWKQRMSFGSRLRIKRIVDIKYRNQIITQRL